VKYLILMLGMMLNLLMSHAIAHEAHTHNSASKLAVSVMFDQQGQLWRASVADGIVYVDSSSDQGKTFTPKVAVNQAPQKVAARGEARPKIAIGPQGYVYLTWTQGLAKRFTGYVWFARSIDGGKSFEKPKIVHQDRAEITHRFDALNVAPDGKITVAWVDKRDLEAAKKTNQPYTGAAIYYAVSTDNGASFQKEKKLVDSSCECCRIALTTKPEQLSGDGKLMAAHIMEVHWQEAARVLTGGVIIWLILMARIKSQGFTIAVWMVKLGLLFQLNSLVTIRSKLDIQHC